MTPTPVFTGRAGHTGDQHSLWTPMSFSIPMFTCGCHR